MKVFIYDAVPNFGDMLNKYIWTPYLGDFIGADDKILMFGIGTVLGEDTEGADTVLVCGSGCGYSRNIGSIDTEKFKIFFVRGKNTERLLNLPEGTGITDPGILTPECFPPSEKHGNIVYVPHWESASSPLWRIACKRAGIQYVDPLAPIEEVMAAISGADLVIAEAMHAAITADAYRVPWVPVATSARINKFKWSDWAGTLNMEPVFHHFKPLGPSDKFRTMTSSRDKEINIDEIGKEIKKSDKDKQPQAKLGLGKTIYKTIVPAFIRNRKDDFLNHKLGPFLDNVMAGLIKIGLPSGSMKRVVAEFEELKKGENQRLSEQEIFDERTQQVREKLGEVKAYLEDITKKAA